MFILNSMVAGATLGKLVAPSIATLLHIYGKQAVMCKAVSTLGFAGVGMAAHFAEEAFKKTYVKD